MGRKAKLKAERREERCLLAAHPERRCGSVHHETRERCKRAGRWMITTKAGQRTYDAKTKKPKDTPGIVYACIAHAVGFRLQKAVMVKIA